MGMTITEKILAAHADVERAVPGDLLTVNVDMALANDITAPKAIRVFDEIGKADVFDRGKIALVPDHFVPNKDIPSAQQAKSMREFAGKHQIKNYFEIGESGIEHILLPEKGLVLPGDLIVGADSHTVTYGAVGAFATGVGSTDLGAIMATGRIWLKVPPTIRIVLNGRFLPWVSAKDLILYILGILKEEGANYRALEFTGTAMQALSMDQRFTMANMVVEAGAKNGIFAPDEMTETFLNGRTEREPVYWQSDADAAYEREINVDLKDVRLQLACPHSPCNVRPVADVKDIRLDQVFIGSCTNGRIEDLRIAAEIINGRSVRKGLRFLVIPGTPLIYRQALAEGIIKVFADAGAVIGPPSCGPCLGGHFGILAEGEKCLATSNRNFIGRMGHTQSEVYLASPAVAAASAVLGRIGSPKEIV